jgi:hypothetical protein
LKIIISFTLHINTVNPTTLSFSSWTKRIRSLFSAPGDITFGCERCSKGWDPLATRVLDFCCVDGGTIFDSAALYWFYAMDMVLKFLLLFWGGGVKLQIGTLTVEVLLLVLAVSHRVLSMVDFDSSSEFAEGYWIIEVLLDWCSIEALMAMATNPYIEIIFTFQSGFSSQLARNYSNQGTCAAVSWFALYMGK